MKLKDNSFEGISTHSPSPSSMVFSYSVDANDYSKIELDERYKKHSDKIISETIKLSAGELIDEYPIEDPILEKLEAIKNDIANLLIDGYVKLSGETVTTNEEKLNVLSNSLYAMKRIDLNMIDDMVNAGEFEKAIIKDEND